MKFALNITDWQAKAPGLSEAAQWHEWSRLSHTIDPAAPQGKLSELPMMTARRLSSGSKLAVECGLAMLRRHAIDAVLYGRCEQVPDMRSSYSSGAHPRGTS